MNDGIARPNPHRKSISGLLKSKIIGCRAYFDSVDIWVARLLTDDEVQQLRALCGSVNFPSGGMQFQPYWSQRIRLNQPTLAALRLVKDLTGGDCRITKVDFALDWHVSDPKEN